jgi:hypothetical protein
MKKLLYLGLTLAIGLVGCKTSEENYRAAYDRAMAGRDSVASLDATIYGAKRRPIGSQTVVSGTDTVAIFTHRVSLTEGGGDALHTFNVVVGQFKQSFNALSMRERLVAAGYEQALVVQTAEPYYYVVLSSWTKRAEAVEALRSIPADFPIALAEPLPYILAAPGRN